MLSALTGAAVLAAFSALSAIVPTAVQTEVPDGPDGAAIAVSDIVAGIMAYTRWPSDNGPVRLCVAGQSRFSTRLASQRLASGRQMAVSRRSPASLPGVGCDAIYLAGLPMADQTRIARAAAGAALVTMTDGDPACDSGIMACMQLVSGGIGFDLNLDAVSRSAVRIDPRVLTLAGRRGEPQ